MVVLWKHCLEASDCHCERKSPRLRRKGLHQLIFVTRIKSCQQGVPHPGTQADLGQAACIFDGKETMWLVDDAKCKSESL